MKPHSCYLKIKLEVPTPRCTLVDLTLGIWFIPTPFLTPSPKPTSVENNAGGLCPQQIYSPLSSQLTTPAPSRGSSCLKQRVPSGLWKEKAALYNQGIVLPKWRQTL